MKNTHLIFLMIGLSLIVSSCDQEENPNEQKLAFDHMSNEDQIDYAKTNLLMLGNAAIALADDQAFRSTLYKEIEKAFDGEYNVLIKTLSNQESSQNGRSKSKMYEALADLTGNTTNTDKVLTLSSKSIIQHITPKYLFLFIKP